MDKPEITKMKLLSMQVCVSTEWSDEQIKTFAEANNPCGTTGGWYIRKAGSELLAGMPERNPCKKKLGYIHVMLDT